MFNFELFIYFLGYFLLYLLVILLSLQSHLTKTLYIGHQYLNNLFLSINLSNITFLDDNLNNLIIAKNLGLSVFFASWGYSMENEKKQVVEMGIPIVALEDFENWAMDIVKLAKDLRKWT